MCIIIIAQTAWLLEIKYTPRFKLVERDHAMKERKKKKKKDFEAVTASSVVRTPDS